MVEFVCRAFAQRDRALYHALVREFYASGASVCTVSQHCFDLTFDEMMRSDAYVYGRLFEVNGEAAGFALFAKTFSQEAGGLVLWLEELYVRPDFRKQGIATRFLKELLRFPPEGVRRIRLEVEPSHTAQRRLYESVGFSALPYEQLVAEFPDGEQDAAQR